MLSTAAASLGESAAQADCFGPEIGACVGNPFQRAKERQLPYMIIC